MSFDSLQEFVAMGGHGRYVWLAYGVTAAALGINLFNLVRAHRRALGAAARERDHAA